MALATAIYRGVTPAAPLRRTAPAAPLRPVARPGAARELITSVDRDEVIEVTGAVGVTSASAIYSAWWPCLHSWPGPSRTLR